MKGMACTTFQSLLRTCVIFSPMFWWYALMTNNPHFFLMISLMKVDLWSIKPVINLLNQGIRLLDLIDLSIIIWDNFCMPRRDDATTKSTWPPSPKPDRGARELLEVRLRQTPPNRVGCFDSYKATCTPSKRSVPKRSNGMSMMQPYLL